MGNALLPIPTITDYFGMHRAVQYDIVETFGYGMEVYVVGTRGVGRLDIYDGYTNSYYEVKHIDAAFGKVFDSQLEKYDAAFVVGWRFSEYSIGGNIKRGQAKILGTTQYSYWDIHYRSSEPGVIIYTWKLNKARYERHLATITVAASAMAAGYVYAKLGGTAKDLIRDIFE